MSVTPMTDDIFSQSLIDSLGLVITLRGWAREELVSKTSQFK